MANHDINTSKHVPWYNLTDDFKEQILPELSEREAEIAIIYSSGIDVRSISHFMKISDKTVNNHLANAKTKLDSTNVAELRSAILLRFLVAQFSCKNTSRKGK